MGVNDLNLLKSWNPNLLKNKKVKTDQDIKDRKKKELKDEILNMQESKKIKKPKKKVTKFTSEDPMSQF